eukprot:3366443-Prymnesium_polylepis.1
MRPVAARMPIRLQSKDDAFQPAPSSWRGSREGSTDWAAWGKRLARWIPVVGRLLWAKQDEVVPMQPIAVLLNQHIILLQECPKRRTLLEHARHQRGWPRVVVAHGHVFLRPSVSGVGLPSRSSLARPKSFGSGSRSPFCSQHWSPLPEVDPRRLRAGLTRTPVSIVRRSSSSSAAENPSGCSRLASSLFAAARLR